MRRNYNKPSMKKTQKRAYCPPVAAAIALSAVRLLAGTTGATLPELQEEDLARPAARGEMTQEDW